MSLEGEWDNPGEPPCRNGRSRRFEAVNPLNPIGGTSRAWQEIMESKGDLELA